MKNAKGKGGKYLEKLTEESIWGRNIFVEKKTEKGECFFVEENKIK